MKCQIPEISWHNRDPVLSVDIQPRVIVDGNSTISNKKWRLASGGTDAHVLIWYLQNTETTGQIELECAADLSRHQRAVNVVRWSPNGELLASGDDESVIFIWKLKADAEATNICDDTNEQDKETWLTLKILRGHMEDVYDLSWSPTSSQLISASVDNTAMLWDVHKGKSICILQDHQGFVQGCTWDPKNKYVATLSSDRNFRVYNLSTKKLMARSSKCVLPVPVGHPLAGDSARLYHDDTLQTFFRRLSFSPDGSLIVAPSGVANESKQGVKPVHTSYIYTRNSWKTPAIVLPSPDQYTVAARFCPILFQLRPVEEAPIIPLPYRMVFAIATKSSVYLYDTQQKTPFAIVSNIHYTRLTDLAWSEDGRILVVSSTDGFCSILTFDVDELGIVYVDDKTNCNNKTGLQDVTNTKDSDPVAQKKAQEKKPLIEKKSPESKQIIESGDKIIEIPCDKIISVDQKFSSPEKKDKPVTPIAIRKHPRPVQPSSSSEDDGVKRSSPKTDNNSSTTPKNNTKKANPIAIRRQPRSILPQPIQVKKAPGPVKSDTSVHTEEAVDAWPIDQPKPSVKQFLTETLLSPGESDRTQDIVLIVDDDDDDNQKPTEIPDAISTTTTTSTDPQEKMDVDEEGPVLPTAASITPKTPRRVEFHTISTPKSKKKLL